MSGIKNPPPAVVGVSKVILCIMPIAYIAVGAVYLNECPVQEKIPIYLIVSGVFTIVVNVLSCLPGTRSDKDGQRTMKGHVLTFWNSLVSVFLFCWFISGNIWIYSIYQPEYNKNATDVSRYCNKTLYLFAFWNTTLVYILMMLLVLTGCCVLFCFFLCSRADADDDANQQA